jgi:VIT1/CCC1 family predicted Fe2+/Mn2+ transporter
MPVSQPLASRKRVLEPSDRISEVLFGVIMALTFTGSLSIANAGRDDIRTMLVGALGCNLAWGLIDAILYLMGCLAEKGRSFHTYHAVRSAGDPAQAHQVIAGTLPQVVAATLEPAELERVRQRLLELTVAPDYVRLDGEDWRGALAVFLLVFCSTFPIAIPFIVMHDVPAAMRASNAVAIVMLFVTGYAYGRVVERHPWVVGVGMVGLGGVLVALTMALGG